MAKQRVGVIITLEEVHELAFNLAREHLPFNEPIPEFSTRFPNRLESCINLPFQRVYGQSLYPSLVAKGAILFYVMIKNHPFQNGNKRIAIMVLLMFLQKHNKWLAPSMQELYDITKWIAASSAKDKDFVIMSIERFLDKFIVPFEIALKNGEGSN